MMFKFTHLLASNKVTQLLDSLVVLSISLIGLFGMAVGMFALLLNATSPFK